MLDPDLKKRMRIRNPVPNERKDRKEIIFIYFKDKEFFTSEMVGWK